MADHPYYGTGGQNQAVVTARLGFDYKQIPAIIIHPPSGRERFLDLANYIGEVEGHVQLSQNAYFLSEVYEAPPDPLYPVDWQDETYELEVKSRATMIVRKESDSSEVEHAFEPDEEYHDFIPGAIIRLASMNNIAEGNKATVVTYAESRIVGDLHGGEWPLDCRLDCLANRNLEAEELADLAIGILSVGRDEFYQSTGIQPRHIAIGGTDDIPTDRAEEIWGHSLTMEFALEWRIFKSQRIVKGYSVDMVVSPPDAQFDPYRLTGGEVS